VSHKNHSTDIPALQGRGHTKVPINRTCQDTINQIIKVSLALGGLEVSAYPSFPHPNILVRVEYPQAGREFHIPELQYSKIDDTMMAGSVTGDSP
jgi:hypothetical protein